MRKKYKRTFLINGQEVDRTTFISSLEKQCFNTLSVTDCISVSVMDTDMAKRQYNKLMKNDRLSLIYCNDGTGKSQSFHIKKEIK